MIKTITNEQYIVKHFHNTLRMLNDNWYCPLLTEKGRLKTIVEHG